MYRLVTLSILNPIIIFITYLVVGYFLFSFYGCTRGCVHNIPFEIFRLGYEVVYFTVVALPFSLIGWCIVLPLLIIAIRNHSLRFIISKQTKIALLAGAALIPLPGIIFVINRANQHPYYWDIVNKGIDTSYLSFVSGDIIWFTCVYIVFLLVIYLLIKLFERKA